MQKSKIYFALVVSALGNFVDVYDIIIFTAIRVASLKSLGVDDSHITTTGIFLLNAQLMGMVLGGLFWGVMGDRRGRLSVLFGSIILYSVANMANAFVTSISMYAVLRFLAGVGLSGELGAGVTLVSELMPKEKRGWGPMIILFLGVLGGIFGGTIGRLCSWQTAYLIGGGMGLVLLFLRWNVTESDIFKSVLSKPVSRGNIGLFFLDPHLRWRYLRCLALGIPVWFFIGVIVTLAPEIASALHISGAVFVATSIVFFNIGFGVGDLSSTMLSQWLKSRKKAAAIHVATASLTLIYLLTSHDLSPHELYILFMIAGFGVGYWAIFLMLSAEQFGTDIRATASISLPNLVRGMTIPISILLTVLQVRFGILLSLALIGFVILSLAVISLYNIKETFGRDMNFTES